MPPDNEMEVPLRQHLERIIDDFRSHVDQRFDSAQTAIDKAERTMNERLQGMNEFRDTLRDQAAKFATIVQLDDRLHGVDKDYLAMGERLTELERWKNNMQGRMWAIPSMIGVFVFVLTQLMRVLFPAGAR
jgi:transcriptional accessory protein Tex/SPT6